MTTRTMVYEAARIGRRRRRPARSSRGPIARRGAVIVWVAILGVVLMGFLGLAMDAGVILLAGSQLQIAADAGSLAGARWVRERDLNNGRARDAARAIALENKAATLPVRLHPFNDIVIGRFYRFADPLAAPSRCPVAPCFIPQADPEDRPNAVRVLARRETGSNDGQVPLVFGSMPLFNVRGIDVERTATAINAGSTGAGLLVLCPDCECALNFNGGTNLVLENAPGYDGDSAIQVNSDDNCAVCGSGSDLYVKAPEMNIVGSDAGYCFTGNPTLDTHINPDSPSMEDPLAGLQPPLIGTDLGEIRTGGTYVPGYYSGGLDISGNGVVTLLPGNYIFGIDRSEGGLQVNGTAGLMADKVFLYIESGPVTLNGTGGITITPSDVESDPYWGISVFQARNNYTPAEITGNGDMNLKGTYYFPKAGYPDQRVGVDIGGDSTSFGIQVIAWKLQLHGNTNLLIEYDGRFQCGSKCTKVFLVQ